MKEQPIDIVSYANRILEGPSMARAQQAYENQTEPDPDVRNWREAAIAPRDKLEGADLYDEVWEIMQRNRRGYGR